MSSENQPARKRRNWRRIWAIITVVILAAALKYVLHMMLPRNFTGNGEPLPIELPHGPFQVLYFNGEYEPKGIVILGSGSGGWSSWEEKVAEHLVAKGYAVGGWDCRKFADRGAYDRDELVAGFAAAVGAVGEHSGASEVPVWFGGWSTGAEQSVAAADREKCENLVGLLLVGPAARGRFGLTQSDLLGMEATGPGSFALADYASRLDGVRLAQFAAGLDPLDSTDWYPKSKGTKEYRIFSLPHAFHDMDGAGTEFLKKLDEAMAWTLEGKS